MYSDLNNWGEFNHVIRINFFFSIFEKNGVTQKTFLTDTLAFSWIL